MPQSKEERLQKVREYNRKRVELLGRRPRSEKEIAQNNARAAQWKKDNPERFKEHQKRWIAKNQEKRKAYNRDYSRRRSDKLHADHVRRTYGLTGEQYIAMCAAQDWRCAICGVHQSELVRRLHVDHCHETGQVRGALCTKCNSGIAHLGESDERMRLAMAYLAKWRRAIA